MKIGISFFKSSPRRLITSEWLFAFSSYKFNSFGKKFILLKLSYSDIWLQFEKGQCLYNFTESNPENLRKLFEIYQAEAISLTEKKLTYPALDFVLKCSHTFNLLDARGVISVTDRAQYIEKIRNLAREVASSWIEERKLLQYPLIKK